MSVVIRTDRDPRSGVTTVWMSGELTWASASRVRAVLADCVVECPVAVIVELSGLRAERSGILGVFPAAARRAARDHGVPLLMCAAGQDIAGPLAAARAVVRVYPSHGDALAAVREARPRWVRARMAAVAEDHRVFRIRPERLTEREVDVLRYLSTMSTIGRIATELDLSVCAVKAHMKSLYRKLDASRRREAVDRAYGLGVIARRRRPTRDGAANHGDAGPADPPVEPRWR
jgi:DNA-binding NarL/FixJ family response regulator